ncbi:hypothetical protein Trydic_g8141 [Trypoxylus dichotomus]
MDVPILETHKIFIWQHSIFTLLYVKTAVKNLCKFSQRYSIHKYKIITFRENQLLKTRCVKKVGREKVNYKSQQGHNILELNIRDNSVVIYTLVYATTLAGPPIRKDIPRNLPEIRRTSRRNIRSVHMTRFSQRETLESPDTSKRRSGNNKRRRRTMSIRAVCWCSTVGPDVRSADRPGTGFPPAL